MILGEGGMKEIDRRSVGRSFSLVGIKLITIKIFPNDIAVFPGGLKKTTARHKPPTQYSPSALHIYLVSRPRTSRPFEETGR